jgi:hypothetical protein
MSEWISVKDRLPGKGLEVLGHYPGSIAEMDVSFIAAYSTGENPVWIRNFIMAQSPPPSHWMPIPAAPEVENA